MTDINKCKRCGKYIGSRLFWVGDGSAICSCPETAEEERRLSKSYSLTTDPKKKPAK